MNLQPVKIYWAVSTVNKWKAQCSGPDNLFVVQYTAYNALYYSIQYKNQRSKHVINVLLLVFGLSQARALRRHHKQYFPFWGNRGKKPFVCCMQPWHGSSPILPQAKSMACRIFTCLLSELAYIGCVTWFETSEINFEWLCLINDMCSLFVFDCCHLCLPVWMTCALECRMCFENENVFRVLLKSLSEICKLCFTMWNGLRLTTDCTIS